MDRWFPRAALAATLGLGVLAGLARAQDVGVITEGSSEPVVVTDCTPSVGSVPLTGPLAGGPDLAQTPVYFPRLRGLLMKHGLTCSTSHNSPGCGSLKAECTFIFGSCHAFYGEPCFAGPQLSPSELYYGTPGSGAPGGGRCGCP